MTVDGSSVKTLPSEVVILAFGSWSGLVGFTTIVCVPPLNIVAQAERLVTEIAIKKDFFHNYTQFVLVDLKIEARLSYEDFYVTYWCDRK